MLQGEPSVLLPGHVEDGMYVVEKTGRRFDVVDDMLLRELMMMRGHVVVMTWVTVANRTRVHDCVFYTGDETLTQLRTESMDLEEEAFDLCHDGFVEPDLQYDEQYKNELHLTQKRASQAYVAYQNYLREQGYIEDEPLSSCF